MYLHSRLVQVQSPPLHAEPQEVESDRCDKRQQKHAQNPALQEAEHWQRENIEARILAENRLRLPERLRIRESKEYLPARRHYRSEDDGEHSHYSRADAQQGLAHEAQQVIRKWQRRAASGQAARRKYARAGNHCHRDRADGEQGYARHQYLDEDAAIAKVIEPEPVRENASPEDEQREKHYRNHGECDPLRKRPYLSEELVKLQGRVVIAIPAHATASVLIVTGHKKSACLYLT